MQGSAAHGAPGRARPPQHALAAAAHAVPASRSAPSARPLLALPALPSVSASGHPGPLGARGRAQRVNVNLSQELTESYLLFTTRALPGLLGEMQPTCFVQVKALHVVPLCSKLAAARLAGEPYLRFGAPGLAPACMIMVLCSWPATIKHLAFACSDCLTLSISRSTDVTQHAWMRETCDAWLLAVLEVSRLAVLVGFRCRTRARAQGIGVHFKRTLDY